MTPDKKPTQDQLIGQIIASTELPDELRAAANGLAQTLWTEQEREYGRIEGAKATAMKAKTIRDLWREHSIQLILDAYDSNGYIFRDSLIEGLRSYNLAYNVKGKGGGQIQRSTISRWLTQKAEGFIRLEAIARIVSRKQKTKP